MSFNSKAYFEYEQRRLEPDNVIRTGNYKRHLPTAQSEKNKWLKNLTPAERAQLAAEYEQEQEKLKYQS